jgi:hypothetical protein
LHALLFIFSTIRACIIPVPIACITNHPSIENPFTSPLGGATTIVPRVFEKYPLGISAKAFYLYDEIIDLHKNSIFVKVDLFRINICFRASDETDLIMRAMTIRRAIYAKGDKQHEEQFGETVFHKIHS